MALVWTVAVKLYGFAPPVVLLVYPLYASITAIESPFKEDDTQWLSYWVLYSFIQLFEIAFDKVLEWLPFWGTFKLVVGCWLVLPQFQGASYVYDTFVRAYFAGPNPKSKEFLNPGRRPVGERMSSSSRTTISAFIDEYGSSAFDNVIASLNDAKRKSKTPMSTKNKGSPSAAQPIPYKGPSPSSQSDDGGHSKFDAFTDYCKTPVKLLKTSFHSLENRRNDKDKHRTELVD